MKCIQLTKYGTGIALILLVAVIWVAASEWIQYIFGELDFEKPFFLTYFNTAGFSLWNLGFVVAAEWRSIPLYSTEKEEAEEYLGEVDEAPTPPGGTRAESTACVANEMAASAVPSESQVARKKSPYSLMRLWRAALMFCPLWFLANVLFNYSLSRTSVASNTILSTTSSIWTLWLSWWILGHPINWLKLLAVALTIGGGSLIATSTKSDSNTRNTLFGNLLALLSAVFYAAYTTVLRWCLPDEGRYSMGVVFGAVGVWNILFLWPGFILLHFSGIEEFALPPLKVLWPLALNALIGTNLSDVLWARSVILTSPLVATLGLSLTIPIAMAADAVIKSSAFAPLYFVGAACVVAGFVLSNLTVDIVSRWVLCCMGSPSRSASVAVETPPPSANNIQDNTVTQ